MNKASVTMSTRLGSPSVGKTSARSDRIAGAVRGVLGGMIALLMFGGLALAANTLGEVPGTAPPAPPRPDPDFCAGIPASWTPPQGFATYWAQMRQSCVDGTNSFENCMEACLGARDVFQRWKEGDFSHRPTSKSPPPAANPTQHSEIPLPGGGSVEGYSGSARPYCSVASVVSQLESHAISAG
jgi:hypothetical protein